MSTHDRVTTVPLPAQSRVSAFSATPDLADAYSIELPDRATRDPERLARFVFAQRSRWMDGLMRIRDALVAGFGLKTATQLRSPDAARDGRVGIFRIYGIEPAEIVLGEDDKHLDFRLSVLCADAPSPGAKRLVVSTVVQCHNALGRTYIRLIAPFHRLIIRATLRNAARAGWPNAAD